MTRLAADLWVSAYRARLEAEGLAVYIVSKGDPTAGAILVKVARLDGAARLHGRLADAEGGRPWTVIAEGDETAVDAAIDRQRRFDPDIWVIEVEARDGDARLDRPGFV